MVSAPKEEGSDEARTWFKRAGRRPAATRKVGEKVLSPQGSQGGASFGEGQVSERQAAGREETVENGEGCGELGGVKAVGRDHRKD